MQKNSGVSLLDLMLVSLLLAAIIPTLIPNIQAETGIFIILSIFISTFPIHFLFIKHRHKKLSLVAKKLDAKFSRKKWPVFGVIKNEHLLISFSQSKILGTWSDFTSVTHLNQTMDTSYMLEALFFKNFPDWNYAKIWKFAEKRYFLHHYRKVNDWTKLETKEEKILSDYLSKLTLDTNKLYELMKENRIGKIKLLKHGITTEFYGVVSDFDRLQETLKILEQLAG